MNETILYISKSEQDIQSFLKYLQSKLKAEQKECTLDKKHNILKVPKYYDIVGKSIYGNRLGVDYGYCKYSTPAYNYEIITVCINGQLITYEGSVEFIFVENENKIEVTEKPNIVHSDKVIVYTSKDSVEYLGTIGIGK